MRDAQSPNAYVRNEPADTAFDNRIPQQGENVKRDIAETQTAARNITNEVAAHMRKTYVGVAADLSRMTESNRRFLSSRDNLFDREFVSSYAEDFVNVIAQTHGKAYQALSAMTGDIAGELTDYVLTGQLALAGDKNFRVTAQAFSDVLRNGAEKNELLHPLQKALTVIL